MPGGGPWFGSYYPIFFGFPEKSEKENESVAMETNCDVPLLSILVIDQFFP